ncbi:6549_t:CDS:2, partial [Gigaspora margarita]
TKESKTGLDKDPTKIHEAHIQKEIVKDNKYGMKPHINKLQQEAVMNGKTHPQLRPITQPKRTKDQTNDTPSTKP